VKICADGNKIKSQNSSVDYQENSKKESIFA
jgi:hypothetical protein